jgi:prepilin-type N-terminal cleavage/methylation domain-containing protein
MADIVSNRCSSHDTHPQGTILLSKRSGFTLVELLVVVTIIAILVSLLLPAVQSARATARRVQCGNQQKQLATALRGFESKWGRFPVGQYVYIDAHAPDGWLRYSWFHDVLPHLEQQALYDVHQEHYEAGHDGNAFSYTALPEKTVIVPVFNCPDDGESPKIHNGSNQGNQQGFHGNYVLNGGSDYFNREGLQGSTRLDGLFQVLHPVSLAMARDGTTNTLLSSEIVLAPDGDIGTGVEDIRGRYHNVRHAGALFSTLYPPNTTQPDRHNYCNSTPGAPCVPTGTNVIVSARSYHVGGVVTTFADGSVHFISKNVDAEVYRGLGSREGGEAPASQL